MISVVMLCKNNQEYIEKTLSSLSKFPEIILIDTGSTDNTLPIAKKFRNISIFHKSLQGFGVLRNYGAKLASNDWILAIDTDEVLSSALTEEILSHSLDEKNIYEIPFRNYFNGKWIKGCGWHPEGHIRLYHRKKTAFIEAKVHEAVEEKNHHIVKLKNPLVHTPYRSIDDFLRKMQHYTTLFATQYAGKKKSSFVKALMHAKYAFFKSYVLKRGLLLGKEGFIISYYNANTAFYKYVKLLEMNRKKKCF